MSNYKGERMKKDIIIRPQMTLLGISARTSNAREMNPDTALIGKTWQAFFKDNQQDAILHRKQPGKLVAVYTDYESDEHGDYTYFLGEEVTHIATISTGFEALTIPEQTYAKFTSASGKMPTVCIELWQTIWTMQPSDFGGKRNYLADFEIYDERSQDPNQTILDIYIGLSHAH
jgi:predicted transcriptional regulator YdeE